jgi:hypothetical protein
MSVQKIVLQSRPLDLDNLSFTGNRDRPMGGAVSGIK